MCGPLSGPSNLFHLHSSTLRFFRKCAVPFWPTHSILHPEKTVSFLFLKCSIKYSPNRMYILSSCVSMLTVDIHNRACSITLQGGGGGGVWESAVSRLHELMQLENWWNPSYLSTHMNVVRVDAYINESNQGTPSSVPMGEMAKKLQI